MNSREGLKLLQNTALFKSNLWEVTFVSNNEKNISSFLAQSINLPHDSFDFDYDKVRERSFSNTYTKPNEMTISFLETEDLAVTKYIEDWLSTYFDNNGRYITGIDPRRRVNISLYRFIKTPLTASLLFPGGNIREELIRSYYIKGLQYKDRSDFTFDYETGEQTIIEVNFTFDFIAY